MLDRGQQVCDDNRTVERRLGILTGPLAGDPLVLREQALLTGVRTEGGFAAFDRGLALGGFGELVTIAESGAWRRIALGAKDLVSTIHVADLDLDGDDDLMVLIERSIVSHGTAISTPFAHFLAQEPDRFELRSTLQLQADAAVSHRHIADLTADGKPDVAEVSGSQLRVYRGDGALRFAPAAVGPRFPDAYLNSRCFALFSYDRDGDADTDLIAQCAEGSLENPFMLAFDHAGGGRFTIDPLVKVDLPGLVRTNTQLQDVTGDAQADMVVAYLGADAEPRLALLRGGAGPLKLEAPEAIPLGAGMLGATGWTPALFAASGQGASLVAAWPALDSKLTVVRPGRNRGDGWMETQHRLETDLPATIVVRDGAADSPPRVHVLLDVACSTPCTAECKRCWFDRCVLGATGQ